jgi:hypothetical protein
VPSVAEVVEGVGLAVTELLEYGERLPAAGDGLRLLAEEGVIPADRVEEVGLAVPVAGRLVQLEGQFGLVEGLGQATPAFGKVGDGVAGVTCSIWSPMSRYRSRASCSSIWASSYRPSWVYAVVRLHRARALATGSATRRGSYVRMLGT